MLQVTIRRIHAESTPRLGGSWLHALQGKMPALQLRTQSHVGQPRLQLSSQRLGNASSDASLQEAAGIGCPNRHLQRRELLEGFVSRPCVVEAFNRNRTIGTCM